MKFGKKIHNLALLLALSLGLAMCIDGSMWMDIEEQPPREKKSCLSKIASKMIWITLGIIITFAVCFILSYFKQEPLAESAERNTTEAISSTVISFTESGVSGVTNAPQTTTEVSREANSNGTFSLDLSTAPPNAENATAFETNYSAPFETTTDLATSTDLPSTPYTDIAGTSVGIDTSLDPASTTTSSTKYSPTTSAEDLETTTLLDGVDVNVMKSTEQQAHRKITPETTSMEEFIHTSAIPSSTSDISSITSPATTIRTTPRTIPTTILSSTTLGDILSTEKIPTEISINEISSKQPQSPEFLFPGEH